jgi:hypothetical protein
VWRNLHPPGAQGGPPRRDHVRGRRDDRRPGGGSRGPGCRRATWRSPSGPTGRPARSKPLVVGRLADTPTRGPTRARRGYMQSRVRVRVHPAPERHRDRPRSRRQGERQAHRHVGTVERPKGLPPSGPVDAACAPRAPLVAACVARVLAEVLRFRSDTATLGMRCRCSSRPSDPLRSLSHPCTSRTLREWDH